MLKLNKPTHEQTPDHFKTSKKKNKEICKKKKKYCHLFKNVSVHFCLFAVMLNDSMKADIL